MKDVNVSLKVLLRAKKDYSWNTSTYICENGKYLKSIANDSKIVFDEIANVMDIVSTKITNAIVTNATSTKWL